MLPIVYIGGCSNCKFSEEVCFGWSFVKNPDGGGIATFGYNALGFGIPGYLYNSDLVGAMELCFFKAYKINNAGTTGELWGTALNNYLNNHWSYNAYDCKTVEELEPFCDPTLRIVKISDRPNKPTTPNGPTSGSSGIEYAYSASSTDPNGDLIKYCFDWGDGTVTWSDPVQSGVEVTLSHIWQTPGYFEIKIKARDSYGLDSPWSEPITMHISGEILEIQDISGGFFKVKSVVKNIGDTAISDINWSVSVEGGILKIINSLNEGSINENIQVNETFIINSKVIFGVGNVEITVKANTPNSNIAIEEVNGFLFGPLIIIKK
jgi:hypothetical protein